MEQTNTQVQSITPERRAEINQQRALSAKQEVIDKVATPLVDIEARSFAAGLNRQALVDLLAQYKVTIANRQFDKWRPTTVTAGWINGLPSLGELLCVATDGMLGLFVNSSGVAHMYHVQEFIWNEAVTSMIPYRKPDNTLGYFKQVSEKGAPGPLHKVHREPAERTVKPKKPTRAERLALL